MRNLIIVCVVVLVVGSTAFAEPELKGTPSELTAYLQSLPKSITLTGESKVEVQADKAIVEISIKTENSSLETCLKSNQALRASITAKLGEAGIPADKIAAEKFSSTPRYGLFGDKPNKYEVRNLVKITVTDEKDFQQIAKIVDQHQEVEYQGLNFKHSNEKELKKQATEKAFDDLLKKKAEYESKLGITLTPRSFSEQLLLLPQEQVMSGKGGAVRSSSVWSYAKKAALSEEETASPFGELVFTANVSGEFELKVKE
jgi:uncharacterized protein YggE